MNAIGIREIAAAVEGRVLAIASAGCRRVSIDSRSCAGEALFIAIKGENHDAHRFINAAIGSGAIAIMAHEPVSVPDDIGLIQVDDTRRAMGRLGNYLRHQLAGKVIGVGGSNGKTSTKHLIHAALSPALRGSISPKSFNNDIGVPLTIFDADPQHDYLVLEMGTNHPGEIANLTGIAQPDIAVITSIGAEHLEFLGDLDGVRRENASIIRGMNRTGTLIINGDDPGLRAAIGGFSGRIITFGFDERNDLFADDVRCTEDGVRLVVRGERAPAKGLPLFVPMLGRHTAANALAAVAVATCLGVSNADIVRGLAGAEGPQWRLQLEQADGVRMLNDAYNANPHSMKAALETVRELPTSGRRVAILGDMRELGATAESYHDEVGRFAASCNLDVLCCVGEKAEQIASAAEAAGMDRQQVIRFADATACAQIAGKLIRRGDLVLLKASRGIHLEKVAAAIANPAEPR